MEYSTPKHMEKVLLLQKIFSLFLMTKLTLTVTITDPYDDEEIL